MANSVAKDTFAKVQSSVGSECYQPCLKEEHIIYQYEVITFVSILAQGLSIRTEMAGTKVSPYEFLINIHKGQQYHGV